MAYIHFREHKTTADKIRLIEDRLLIAKNRGLILKDHTKLLEELKQLKASIN